jgi:hypothetical protein
VIGAICGWIENSGQGFAVVSLYRFARFRWSSAFKRSRIWKKPDKSGTPTGQAPHLALGDPQDEIALTE